MSSRSAFEEFVKSSEDSSKQLNLGWTVTSWIFTAAFFLGVFLVAMLLVVLAVKPEYRNATSSRKGIIILGWVGFGLIIFGLWSTINSFYQVVQKINQDVRIRRGCSLFNPENARNAVETIAANENIDDDLSDFINARKNNVTTSSFAGDEYQFSDASSRLSRGKADTPGFVPGVGPGFTEPGFTGFTNTGTGSGGNGSSAIANLLQRAQNTGTVLSNKQDAYNFLETLNDEMKKKFRDFYVEAKQSYKNNRAGFSFQDVNNFLRQMGINATITGFD